MHIGLIGGIGPAATDFYYRRLIEAFASRGADLDATIVHADAPTLLDNVARNDVEAQVAIYQHLTDRLAAAGADCVIVTSIAGHFCIEPFKQVSPLPVIDLLTEVDKVVSQRGFNRLGILGTATVMKTQFYGGLTSAQVVPPEGELFDAVHRAYVTMATSGRVTDDERAVFDRAVRSLSEDAQADAILLGGTDLGLVYSEDRTDFTFVDCAAIHVDAVVERALE